MMLKNDNQPNSARGSQFMMTAKPKEEFNQKLILSGFFEDDYNGDIKINCNLDN